MHTYINTRVSEKRALPSAEYMHVMKTRLSVILSYVLMCLRAYGEYAWRNLKLNRDLKSRFDSELSCATLTVKSKESI